MATRPQSLPAAAARTTLIERFGPQVITWCDELPRRIATLAAAWKLRVEQALPAGGTSVLLRCRTDDEQPVVLKLTPDTAIAAAEETALDAWTGSPHVVALLDADTGQGALMLEALDPGTPLASDPGHWSLPDIAPLLADLWRPRPLGAKNDLPDLRERVEFLFDLTENRIRQWPAAAGHLPQEVLGQSRASALALAADGPVTLLHGDLHPGNVLRARRGLVAIDPRPCIGDRNFDAVDWVLAGATSTDDLERNIDQLASLVAALDPMRTWSWCQATAPILAVIRLRRDPDNPYGHFLAQLAAGTV